MEEISNGEAEALDSVDYQQQTEKPTIESISDEVDAFLESGADGESLSKKEGDDDRLTHVDEDENFQPYDHAGNDEEQPATEPTSQETEGEEEPNATRYRIRAANEVEAKALTLKKRNPDMSLEDCLMKVKDDMGLNTPDPKVPELEQQESQQEPARTVATVQQEIDDLESKAEEAARDMDFEESARLQREVRKLMNEERDLKFEELLNKQSKEAEMESALDQQIQQSKEKAVQAYPDTQNAESPLSARMREIHDDLEILGDDLVEDPNKYLKIAQMAAKELGIAPNRPSQKIPTSSTPRKSPIMPAMGSQRTSVASPTSAEAKFQEQIQGVKTLTDIEDMLEDL